MPIKVWELAVSNLNARASTTVTATVTLPESTTLVGGDFVALELPFGWDGVNSQTACKVSSAGADGALTEVGNTAVLSGLGVKCVLNAETTLTENTNYTLEVKNVNTPSSNANLYG